jgi:hypothetical protein
VTGQVTSLTEMQGSRASFFGRIVSEFKVVDADNPIRR